MCGCFTFHFNTLDSQFFVILMVVVCRWAITYKRARSHTPRCMAVASLCRQHIWKIGRDRRRQSTIETPLTPHILAGKRTLYSESFKENHTKRWKKQTSKQIIAITEYSGAPLLRSTPPDYFFIGVYVLRASKQVSFSFDSMSVNPSNNPSSSCYWAWLSLWYSYQTKMNERKTENEKNGKQIVYVRISVRLAHFQCDSSV